jgi:hypothetical protein
MTTKDKALEGPATHTAALDETLREIALRNGMEESELRRLNDFAHYEEPDEDEKVVLGFVPDEATLTIDPESFGLEPKGFSRALLAVQHELLHVGILPGRAVTGLANAATKEAFRLWKLILGVEDEGVDDFSLRVLGARRNRFVIG